jgi:spermidine synthase
VEGPGEGALGGPVDVRREGTLSAGVAAVALCLSGGAVLSLEVVWFRFLGSALGHFRAVLALTLACVLLGLWAGELIAGALSRRVAPSRVFVWAQGLGVAVVVAAFAAHDPYRVLQAQLGLSPLMANLLPTAMLVLPAAAALGAGLPMALAAVRTPAAGAGRQTGALLAANAGGNLLGAVVTGLVVLPALGMQGTVGLACGAALLAGALVAVAEVRSAGVAPLLMGALALVWLGLQPADRLLWAAFPHGRIDQEGVLAVAEGAEYTVVVTGEVDGPARLWTSGHPMASTTLHAQRYMRVLAHLPLLLQESPERALVICFGVGNTAHAVSLHPSITQLDIADLSADVLRHAAWFEHANHGVIDDPRVRVFVDDGRRVLAATRGVGEQAEVGDADEADDRDESWDLIVLEPPPIGYAGVSALYARELYAQARARLSTTGCVSQWAPLYQVSADAQMSLVRSFSDVFPDGVVIVADRRELVLLGCREGAPPVTLRDVQRRLEERRDVALDLSRLGIADAGDLLARFGGSELPAVTEGFPPVTLDDPLLEYNQMSQVTETRMPAALFSPDTISAWCADCPVPDVDYSDEAFLRFTNRPDR